MAAAVMWFRRDLRVRDNPALYAAAAHGEVLPLFVLDPALWQSSGDVRRTYLLRSLHALDASLDGHLHVRRGDPVREVVEAARAAGADEVHAAADFNPYGRRRDESVDKALAEHGIALVRTGSPYAVAPGRVRKPDGTPYGVFTPFSRAWAQHGWPAPATPAGRPAWRSADGAEQLPDEPDLPGVVLPPAGEDAARESWGRFLDTGVVAYADRRNRPDLAGTSRMSHHLKWGEVHPRTLLADLAALTGGGKGADSYRNELAWREFYADVLHHRPDTAREHLRPEFVRMRHDEPGPGFEAWGQGRTGFPFVDAGMRQLRAEGWMHNRLRMVVASFLVKDLHVSWQHGGRHFMRWLRDADLASNMHGWQWTAGTGTDAAPFVRVYNPVTQGQRFDPDGDYVRRYVPELRHLEGTAAHEPWNHEDGYAHGYPRRIVDHMAERRVALERYAQVQDR